MQSLICNYKGCKKEITGVGFVTSCSHIFCREHYESLLRNKNCPACHGVFSDMSQDILETKTMPSERFKSMILSGLSPEVIFEISQRGLQFWMYQLFHRESYLEDDNKRLQEALMALNKRYYDAEREHSQEMDSMRFQNETLAKDLRQAKAKFESMVQVITQKTRAYTKLENKYEELRRNMIKSNFQYALPVDEGKPVHDRMDAASMRSYSPYNPRDEFPDPRGYACQRDDCLRGSENFVQNHQRHHQQEFRETKVFTFNPAPKFN